MTADDDTLVLAREASRIVGTAVSRIRGWRDGGRLTIAGTRRPGKKGAHLFRLGDVRALLALYEAKRAKPARVKTPRPKKAEPPPEGAALEDEPGRGVVQCWACPATSSTRLAKSLGWRFRTFFKAESVRETYCPECFAEWGWPPAVPRVASRDRPHGPRVYRCHVPGA